MATFFKDLDDTTKVRARDLGHGTIQLYVRKNSFKQFFTDKLRLGFLVERDYSNAVKQIDTVLRGIGEPDWRKYKEEQTSAYTEFKKHNQNFYAAELKNHFIYLAELEKKQLEARQRLDSCVPKYGDKLCRRYDTTLNNAPQEKKVKDLILSLLPPQKNEEVSYQIDNFFLYLSHRLSLYSLRPLTIDFEAARDFAQTWIDAITAEEAIEPNATPSEQPLKLDTECKEILTELCQKIANHT